MLAHVAMFAGLLFRHQSVLKLMWDQVKGPKLCQEKYNIYVHIHYIGMKSFTCMFNNTEVYHTNYLDHFTL